MTATTPILVKHRCCSGHEVALLFLHGFGGNAKQTWGSFPQWVIEDPYLKNWDVLSLGYATTLFLDLPGIWSANPNLVTLADELRTAVSLLPHQRLAVIAHSMGGLVVQRALVDSVEFARRCSHVFLFGTPSCGLLKAWLARFWKRQIRDMACGSEFIVDLRKRWSEQPAQSLGFEFWAVGGDQDEFVPRQSSLEPFAQKHRAVVPGNHLDIVKPQASDHPSVQLVLQALRGGAAPAGPWNSARVAVESGEFQDAIDRFWPHRAQLDEAGVVQLALALEAVGRQPDAIQTLEAWAASNCRRTDAIGVLAGRIKRRWMVEHTDADARRARELYQRGLQLAEQKNDHAQAFYHGINVAFMNLTHESNREAAKAMADRVLAHCSQADGEEMWRLATQGEAWLILGETEVAIANYTAAVALKPTPRQLHSMFQQAMLVAGHLGNSMAKARLRALFRTGEV